VTLSLRTRLTLSYILVALLGVLLVSALANGLLERTFQGYVRGSLAQNSRQIVAQVGDQRQSGGDWDQAGLTTVGMSALEEGFIIRVEDRSGRVVWDATLHNNGLCVQMLDHMARNMSARYPGFHGAYTETSFPVRADFADVGTVSIGYYGPFFLNDQELAFITSLNRLLLAVGVLSLVLAAGIGLFMARGITRPVRQAVAATRRIADGNSYEPLRESTGVRELDSMAAAVNHLSRTLEDQESLRRRLSADMAHEIRTPLATLQSHVEALIDGVWQPDAGRLAALHEEILRVNRLVSDMEKLSRLEGEPGTLALRPTGLSQLVGAQVGNLEPRFREKGVGLSCPAPVDPDIEVMVDPDRLSQAVINLLSNALEFTPAGGNVDVRVSRDARGASLEVSDTGIGIGAADLPRIFERFYRVDPSRNRSTGGAGIGLAIARAIVQTHGGSITATSEPGKGSRFVITLPLPADSP
jgi:two-component system sensor histidine kinase BaeS